MYERSAIVLEKYFNNICGFDKKINLKTIYKDYKEITEETQRYQTILEEEDKIILVDYKTDRVREGEEDILIRRYRAQMESYQQALEKITGKCVKEIYIYSVTLQKTIPVHV